MTNRWRKKPEILAPAGNYAILEAAFRAGADAVYVGGQAFGARAYAANFSQEELTEAIHYANFHEKKVYLTVNTLVKETEIDALPSFLLRPYEAGLHGVIVQDIGVARLIHREYPDLPLHISTQMSVTSGESIKILAEKYKITRVVPARELSLKELVAIKKETGIELEVFVHGALCVCYSGQCLMSSMIGGRSGNRGQCAQPCRRLYRAGDLEGYLLSPKDLCTLPLIPEYMEAGFDSYKIEGRMKNAEYVISAVEAYRRAVDCYAALWDEIPEKNPEEGLMLRKEAFLKRYPLTEESNRLRDIYNRGSFTTGYGNTDHGKSMMDITRNHHNGLLVGKVLAVKGGKIQLDLTEEIHPRDVLEIRNGRDYVELTNGIACAAGKAVWINAKDLKRIAPGLSVYRTKNHVLCDALIRENRASQLKENIKISVILEKDRPAIIKAVCKEHMVTVAGMQVMSAEKRPLTREVVLEKLNKIGDYPFVLQDIFLSLDADAFLPMPELNRLKREACDALLASFSTPVRKKPEGTYAGELDKDLCGGVQPESETICACAVYTGKQCMEACGDPKIQRIELSTETLNFAEIMGLIASIREAKKQVFLQLPRILRGAAVDACEKLLTLQADGYCICSMDMFAYVIRRVEGKRILLEPGVYAYNREAVRAYKELLKDYGSANCLEICFSPELSDKDRTELQIAVPDVTYACQMLYHQPVMITKQCLTGNFGTCKEEREGTTLISEQQDSYLAYHVCKYCYTVLVRKEQTDLRNMPKPEGVRILRYEN